MNAILAATTMLDRRLLINVQDGLFHERYELMAKIGEGRYGEVWRARDTHRDQVVALKLLGPHTTPDDAWQEAIRLTQLESPHILRVHNAALAVDVPYLDTELADSGSLADRISPFGVAPVKAVHWVRQTCIAVALCHDRGLVHRDIKPDNIFLSATDDARLGDFGVAGILDRAGHAEITGDESIRAPELFFGYPFTVSSDCWSLGATLFASLSGSVPLRDSCWNVSEDIRERCPHISRTLARVVRKAVDSNPRDRYRSAPDLGAALARIQRGKRDFQECPPHSGHERCWIGAGVGTTRPVTVCTLAAGQRVEIVTRYGSDGRRITSLTRTVVRSALGKTLRSTFDTLR